MMGCVRNMQQDGEMTLNYPCLQVLLFPFHHFHNKAFVSFQGHQPILAMTYQTCNELFTCIQKGYIICKNLVHVTATNFLFVSNVLLHCGASCGTLFIFYPHEVFVVLFVLFYP